jgi:TetR/AcrR family transcriptional regulator, transcriptional repressor for nem operon
MYRHGVSRASESEPTDRRIAVTPAGQRTRQALLDAGAVVAERSGLAGLSVSAVADAAGVAKGTFYVHFVDRDAFVDAMHERFYETVGNAVRRAVDALPLGAERLAIGANAYLDSCLAQRAVKPLLRDLHNGGCSVAASNSMAERETAFTALTIANLRAMGCRDLTVVARLITAMISETALLEHETGKRSAPARRTLDRLIKAASPGA